MQILGDNILMGNSYAASVKEEKNSHEAIYSQR